MLHLAGTALGLCL